MSQDVLVWCLVAIAVIAVATVVVLIRRTRALGVNKRRSEAALNEQLGALQSQLSVSHAELQQFKNAQQSVISEAERTSEESTKAVLKGAARFLQSLAAEQTTLLDDIQRRYGGHSVLSDLLEVHHANAQMARKAQGIAVMCGAPVGRRNKPASVYDVVRSAQGQIRNFQRIEIMQQSGIALKATAVAPVALAVAELLDNAASFSQHDAPIEVTFQRVQNNLCIVIDDAGVGMNDEDRQKATALLSGDSVPQLSQLGNQPKFGFPVIGLIAGQYGFRVDVTGVSRYGGVRAVVLLPEELWTVEETPPPAEEGDAPISIHRGEGQARAASRTTHGLPKRGSRQAPIAGVPSPAGATAEPVAPAAPRPIRRSSGSSLGALQRGTLSGRDLDAPSPEGAEDA
ncbi:ATP-binding protein [Streptomyces mangrovisoli]|uniref:histidine kinase n=1 Tax=Streptomyces mangrovisoli TaxID=1428628 RepID=A0A1J4NMP2_9ACTN|nr:ATP-binding protein [Streptomyces mangrovisoli]OIJ63689.1 ATP-binding protein [Streptomyces mangrovisoli]